MDERMYWLGFSLFSGVGPRRFNQLLQYFGSAKTAWEASQTDLKNVLGEKLSWEFIDFRSSFSFSDYEKKLRFANVSFVTLTDSNYPILLKRLTRPPFLLYYKGNLYSNDTYHYSIAVVGTRKITQYGRDVTELLTMELVSAGFTIVSGLALGVDAVAHQTAIDHGGKTIAVLGCGVDCVTPRENEALYNSIVNGNGCIVSELPLSHMPTKGSFPARNRIIAGLSQGVLVTEGAQDSGALITADYAIKSNRKVFAVPGPITSQLSKGPYKLIAKGAKLVTTANDIINELDGQSGRITNYESSIKRGETKEEQKILDLLGNESLHFDEIVRRLRLTSSQAGAVLSLLEMKGIVKSSAGGIFSLAK